MVTWALSPIVEQQKACAMVKPHDKPAKVERVDDEILVNGPDGMTTSMTPEAALETAQRLESKAVEAIVARNSVDGAVDRDVEQPG